MPSALRLCLTLTLFSAAAHVAAAQQQPAATPPQQATPAATDAAPPAATPAVKADDADEDDDDAAPAKPGAPAKEAKSKGGPTLHDVPDDLKNAPLDADLKEKNATWKGEYEADKDGKPNLGPDGKAIPVLYNAKGKRMKSSYKKPHQRPLNIVAGTLTVDGWTGKAQLDYQIPNLKFVYISSPALGTVIVSETAFPGSVEQKNAFNGKTLTVKAGEHEVQLASEQPLLSKKQEAAWVKVDASYTEDPRYPVVGFGSKDAAPYEWPGAKEDKHAGVLKAAPTLPRSMRAKLEKDMCLDVAGRPCAKPAGTPPPAASGSAATPAGSSATGNTGATGTP